MRDDDGLLADNLVRRKMMLPYARYVHARLLVELQHQRVGAEPVSLNNETEYGFPHEDEEQ